jgi:putative ATP-binding cassette transporter
MKMFKLFARTAPWGLLAAVLLGVLGGVAGMGLIAVVNTALAAEATATVVLAFAALCLLRMAFGLGGQLQLHVLGQNAMYELRLRLSRSILETPLRKLEQLGQSKLLAALTEDILVLTRGAYMLATIITQLAFVIACGVYLGVLSKALLGVVSLTLVAGVVFGQLLTRQAGRLMKRARDAQDSVFDGFRGVTFGSKELKLHAGRREEFVARSLDDPSRDYRKNQVRSAGLGFVASQWTSLLFLLLVALLLFEVPRFHPLDAPVLRSYVLAVLYMQSSVEILIRTYPQLQMADVALDKLESLGLSVGPSAEPVDAAAAPACTEIALRGVGHEYHREEGDGVFALGPIDFTVRPGEIVFIVGGNGSGKSTLVKVLTGLYPPQSGEILLNGRVVDDQLRPAYRQLFSAVFSDWYLFDRLHGLGGASLDADAQRYLAELRLDKKVSTTDGSFSSTALSQGQRKRLMMLTAYLEDRPVYVFDEWASDQDPTFKAVFYTQILPRLKERGKMVIVVSHDDRYFSVADKIVRLESGRIVPQTARSSPPAHPAPPQAAGVQGS